MLRRIATAQVRIGMFLHAVEASWLNNPFWRSRFPITQDSEIAALREAGVETVVIDLDRGVGAEPATPSNPVPPVRSFADERDHAAAVIGRSKKAVMGIFEDARVGRGMQSEAVRAVVDEIAGSVRAHPHALIGMVRLKSKDEYTYLHSVAVCALMVNLARELGLDDGMVYDLGLAGLVHDIGKMAVPNGILNKPGPLNDREFDVVRTHPDRGLEMLLRALDMPPMALDVCRHHHEKIDGTGYPERLRGDAISVPARMGAICDVYDALTSDRPYKEGWSPADAVSAMHGWTGQFDPAILFTFFQSIAVFPAGMLVRMRSGHLAIVMPNGRRASRPQVRLFYDIANAAPIAPRDVVLAAVGSAREIVREEAPDDWAIRDWIGLQAHLQGEAEAIERTRIARMWRDPPSPRSP